jgi:hypothetical protein
MRNPPYPPNAESRLLLEDVRKHLDGLWSLVMVPKLAERDEEPVRRVGVALAELSQALDDADAFLRKGET